MWRENRELPYTCVQFPLLYCYGTLFLLLLMNHTFLLLMNQILDSFTSQVFLGFSWQFLKFFRSWWLESLKNTGQIFGKMSLNGGFPDFFLKLDWAYVFLRGKQ